MKFYGEINIDKETKDWINKTLYTSPKNESECFGEDESYSKSYKFPNGYFMCIDMCGIQFEDGSDNTPWTQAVLYDENGSEICFTEPEGDFLGEWELETTIDGENVIFTVNVVCDESSNDESESNIEYYYCLNYFYDRKNNGTYYVKTTIKLGFDEDKFLLELSNSGEYKDIDIMSIVSIDEIDEEEYLNLTE